MNRNKQLKVALPVLLGVAALVWMQNLKPPAAKLSKTASLARHEKSFPDKKGLTVLLNGLSSAKSPDNSTMVWGGRNPFDLNAVGAITATNYHLSGIFWNDTKPSAIINDLVVGVGSTVGSARVKEIGKDKVVLGEGDKDVVLVSRSGDQ